MALNWNPLRAFLSSKEIKSTNDFLSSTGRKINNHEGRIVVLEDTAGIGADISLNEIGAIAMWPLTDPPLSWLLCNGQAVSRTTYADLFEKIGETYGAGDGSTTFQVPNIKGKVVVGQDTGDSDFNQLGETGGHKELEAHAHAYYTNIQHTDGTIVSGEALTSGLQLGGRRRYVDQTQSAGTGDSGNLQPYIILNFIIRYESYETPETGPTGATGAAGADAPQVQTEYSTDGVSWHGTYIAGDPYIHFSVDGGLTYGDTLTIKGADGDDGADGARGSLIYVQSAAPSVGLLAGDLWIDTDDYNYYTYTTEWVLAGNLKGGTGAQGETGLPHGVPYEFSAITAKADPGAGYFRLNNANPAAATEMYIDYTDKNPTVETALFAAIGAVTNTIKGFIYVHSGTGVAAILKITGATDETGYYTFVIENLAYTGMSGGTTYYLLFAQSGDIGANGVSLRNKGAWSSATEYVNDSSYIDVVENDGSGYLCKLTHTNQEPPNATYWDLLVAKGTDGEGAGDVMGPASSTDHSIARFNGTDNKTIQGSLATIDDSGSVNIPSGQAYKINGTAHDHDSDYEPINANIQSHISDTNNPHSVDKTDVGLGNVTNNEQVIAPASTTENKIPQWDSTSKTLKDGLTLDTDLSSVSANDDTIPSAKATKAYVDGEAWHSIGGSGEPAFQNSWTNFGGSWNTAAYRKIGSIVYLKGTIKSGTIDAEVFTLPAGYRPTSGTWLKPGVSHDGSAYKITAVTVATTGIVKINAGGNSFASLDDLWFSVD